MKRTVIAVLAMSIAVAVWAENSVDPKALVGLWAARRDFGPQVRGVLLIEKEGAQWRAQIAGREAPVTIAQGTMSFALPTNEGRFRGSIAGHRVNGYWIQPFGVSTAFEFSTPVTLAKQADGRWRGVVQPIDDHMTMFMPVSSNADGMLTAFLINPERNFGRFTDVRRIELDGTRVTLLGKDNKVVLEGRYDAETDSISVLSWRGGSYDLHRATAADEAAFYPRGKTPVPYVYRKPSERDEGWPIGSIGEAGIDGEALASFINDLTAKPIDSLQVVQIHAFLLARHGKLLVEEYFHGSSPDEPHDTRSAAKSLTAVLTGAAVLHGYPISPATHVYEAMYGKAEAEKVEPRKRGITMEQLLTMSSGLDCDDNDPKSPGQEDTMQEQTVQPDWYRFTLDLKMIREPGQKAVYCSCQPNLAGGVLARTTGKWLPDLFRELVAGPLQFRHWGMPMTPTGDAYMGGGVRLLPRDFMKIGQVMIDGGRWKGKQIISPDWVKRSSSVLYDLPPSHLQYGYLFWITDYPWKERKVRAFFASGNGGQVVMSIPELDLVIGFFGGNYSDSASSQSRRVYVPQYVLPAVK